MISFGPQLADWARTSETLLQQSLASPTPTTLAVVFAGGLLTSLGPCSLSLLPVTLAYLAGFGASAAPDASRPSQPPWQRSLCFAAGIVGSLVLLGLVVAHILALHDVGSNNPDGVEIKGPNAPKDANGKLLAMVVQSVKIEAPPPGQTVDLTAYAAPGTGLQVTPQAGVAISLGGAGGGLALDPSKLKDIPVLVIGSSGGSNPVAMGGSGSTLAVSVPLTKTLSPASASE